MGRILAIDYGRKRTGIAVTDTLKIVATGLATIPTHTIIDFLKKYLQTEKVDLIVIGEPKKLDNTPSESMKYITPFIKRLQKELPEIKFVMWDERFTSSIAHQSLIMTGAKKSTRQEKGLIDSMAATIILNDYLQSNCSRI
ncbi:MAG: Holliday junction resolvase RuvX [Muribaculaceae bacterium]|nr:Holliday junction resolvase RuvX [Muribaculaceae bacterium]